ncbi:GNAT family N-acetyltransferase [Arthrobacter sp. CJ23]|uniref:GNAT family N-acetyltransferase n=1 Tax=Arthrobacter sp. CJ23 TaxID=2972479 RepID=UPI00215D5C64|nr:GNAT family N-acetyltransferase [Arthrobacter sp. CJ23]UVJ37994.1 GNAT family N-acetyltransferase [Arthrobacter sp. CJ23]
MDPKPSDPPGAVTTGPAAWPDVEKLFGVRGEPASCWCRWFVLNGQEWKATPPTARKELLKTRFDDDAPAPGVLAFRAGAPVGWCAVEPRHCYPRIERSRLLRAAHAHMQDPAQVQAEEAGVWSVSCFVVAPGHRRSGVAAALLHAAVGHAFSNGAAVLEGYPVDPAQRPKAGPGDLYHGTVSLFRAAGFETVPTAVTGRAVMRLERARAAAHSAQQGKP